MTTRADYKPGTLIDLAWCDGATVEVKYGGNWWMEYNGGIPPSQTYRIERLRIKPPTPTPEELRIQKNAETRKQWEGMEETGEKGIRLKDGKRFKCEWAFADDHAGWRDNEECTLNRQWIDASCGTGIDYRITELPAPTITPWTFETAPGCALKVRRKRDGALFRAEFRPDLTALYGADQRSGTISYLELRDQFEQLDGAACGSTEEKR